jgi:hypothetical protein
MIRKLMIFWVGPIVFFWGWYYLSLNDAGLVFFSKAVHVQVFALYGSLLGIDPDSIAPMIAKSLVVDSLIVAAVLAFRRRREILAAIAAYRLRRLSPPTI